MQNEMTTSLSRIAGMLREGGILRVRDLFFSCSLSEVHGVVEAWLAGAAERTEDGWTRGELETHLREEHSTFKPRARRSGLARGRRSQRGGTLELTKRGGVPDQARRDSTWLRTYRLDRSIICG